MTELLDAAPRRSHRPRGAGYRDLVQVPHVPAFVAAALVGRLSNGTVGLAVLLLVQHVSGSYAAAGAAVAAYGGTAAVLAPVTAGWALRRGLRSTLPLLVTGYTVAMGVLATCASVPATAVGMSAVAGALAPPLGPATRRTWTVLITDRDLLRRAYGFDAAADEVLFTVGPLLTGLLVVIAGPVAAVLLPAALVIVGTAGMLTSPLARTTAAVPPRPMARASESGGPLRSRGFRRLLLVMFAVGTGLGGIEMAAVGFARLHAGSVDPAPLLATIALGCAVGGIGYGAVRWRRTVRTQLAVLCSVLVCALLGAVAVAATLPLLVVAMFLAGLAISPALVAGYAAADEVGGADVRGDAGTLVGTLNNLGAAAGTAVAGAVLDGAGLGAALVVTAAGTALLAALAAPT